MSLFKIRTSAHLTSLALVISILMTMTPMVKAEAFSAGGSSIAPEWAYASTVYTSLSFANGCAEVYAEIIGYSSATSVVANVTLYQEISAGNWSMIKSWTNLHSSSGYFYFSDWYAVMRGYRYKLVVEGTAYAGSKSEPVSREVISTYQ